MKIDKNTIEKYILDSELKSIAEENDLQSLSDFISKNPEDQDVIQEAFLLLQSLRIKETPVSKERIEEDYKRFQNLIGKRSNRKLYLWLVASVACLFIVSLSVLFTNKRTDLDIYSKLETHNVEREQIQIVSGKSQIEVENNKEIAQTENGDIVIGNEETLRSTDIEDDYIHLIVPKGKRTTLKLNDGSKLWINSGTKLMYPKTFAKDKREIYVDGEIYIEVAKDLEKEFIVKSKNIDVSVLGTKFNFSAYSEDSEKIVVLLDGSVNVLTEAKESRILQPNQGFFYDGGQFTVKDVDASSYISWKDNFMKLQGESLDVIFNRLSRHYAVKFHFNKDLSKERYRGSLNLNESIETVLLNLSIGTSFSYDMQEDGIYINFE